MMRLCNIIVHALAVLGLIALVAHCQSPKIKYSDESLFDDDGPVTEKHVTYRI